MNLKRKPSVLTKKEKAMLEEQCGKETPRAEGKKNVLEE